jgi:hypothetical protein
MELVVSEDLVIAGEIPLSAETAESQPPVLGATSPQIAEEG